MKNVDLSTLFLILKTTINLMVPNQVISENSRLLNTSCKSYLLLTWHTVLINNIMPTLGLDEKVIYTYLYFSLLLLANVETQLKKPEFQRLIFESSSFQNCWMFQKLKQTLMLNLNNWIKNKEKHFFIERMRKWTEHLQM